MKIAVLHDYANVFRETRAYLRLQDHDVTIHIEAYTEPERVVEQAAGCEALLLTQQRVPLMRQIIEQLPDLRFISQTGRNTYHLDLEACTQQGIVISAGGGGGDGGNRYSTTAELTWGLILASLRHIYPTKWSASNRGIGKPPSGPGYLDKPSVCMRLAILGSRVARVGKAFGMKVICWGVRARHLELRRKALTLQPAARHFSKPRISSACICQAMQRPVASSHRMI